MMNNGESKSKEPVVGPGNEPDVDLDAWIDCPYGGYGFGDLMDNINPNYHSQPLMPTVEAGTNLGGPSNVVAGTNLGGPSNVVAGTNLGGPSNVVAGTNFGDGSSNMQQFGIPQDMMASGSMTQGCSIDAFNGSGQNILSSAVQTLSNHAPQSSQPLTPDFQQYQPLQPTHPHQNQPLQPTHPHQYQPLQPTHPHQYQPQVSNNMTVQQPQTHPITNQSNVTFDNQMLNQFQDKSPPNQILPGTGPMANYVQTGNLHSDQTLRVQGAQSPGQYQIPSQQVTGSLGDLISPGVQQGSDGQDLKAPVGFATPQQFSSSDEYRKYIARQIPQMRKKYYIQLHEMFNDAMQRYAQARTVEDSDKYKTIMPCIERMIRFLNTRDVDSITRNVKRLSTFVNVLVNFANCKTRDRPGGSCEPQPKPVPIHQSPNGPSVQIPYPSQRAKNLGKNMVNNFKQNFNSRIPQTKQSRIPVSLDNGTFQIGIKRKPEIPVRIGPSIVPPSNVLFSKQQINLGQNTSSVNGSGSPVSFLSNQAATSLHYRLLKNHQPSVLNSAKLKQPMRKTNQFPKPRVRAGLSPLGSKLVSNYPPNQLPIQSSVNPIISEKPSVPFDVNSLLSPQVIAKSPFLQSSSSSTRLGTSLMTTVENQKHAAPTATPFHEPQVIARSPFLQSSSSSTRSGTSLMTTVENQKHAAATATPFQEPQVIARSPFLQSSSAAPTATPFQEPQVIARSPFLQSSSSSTRSGTSLMTTVENQKRAAATATPFQELQVIARSPFLQSSSAAPTATPFQEPQVIARSPFLQSSSAAPTATPFQEPQTSKDLIHHLTQVVKSISSKASSSSVTDIRVMEKVDNIMPDCIPINPVGEYLYNYVYEEPHPKTRRENNWGLFEEIKDANSNLLETTIHVVLNHSDYNITIHGGQEGVMLKCLFRNMCFLDLFGPQGSMSSETAPEFSILLLVPFDFPASRIRIFKSGQNVLSEPWRMLYLEMVTRFDLSTRGVRGKLFVGKLAGNWDASASEVMNEFLKKLGGESYGVWCGTRESYINSSSGSN